MKEFIKRLLITLLALAFVITALPEAAYSVYANDAVISDVSLETSDNVSETGTEITDEIETETEFTDEIATGADNETAGDIDGEMDIENSDDVSVETVIGTVSDEGSEDDIEIQSISAKCGKNAYYLINDDATILTIYGTGAIWDNMAWPFDITKVTKADIGYGITIIGINAFKGFANLAQISIPDSVTVIGDYAFSDCVLLANAVIPENVTSIGDYAFYLCEALTSITIPEKVTHLGRNVFEKCTTMESVDIKGPIIYIPRNAFYDNKKLSSVTLPDTVISIGNSAFYNCLVLQTVTLPANLKYIRPAAFSGCQKLTSITIPAKVTHIGLNAFGSTSALNTVEDKTPGTWIWINKDNGEEETGKTLDKDIIKRGNYVKDSSKNICGENATYTYDGTDKILTISGSGDIMDYVVWMKVPHIYEVESVVINNGITGIGREAFNGFTKLKSVSIPDTVTFIGENAFDTCMEMESVTIPGSVNSIGANAFRVCSKLDTINLPQSLNSIENGTFSGCKLLTAITLGNNLKYIGASAFYDSGLTEVSIPASVENIGCYAFYSCNELKTVTFNSGLKRIDSYAFNSCNQLENFAFPNTLISIGSDSFSGCGTLSSVTIPESVSSLGSQAFAGCAALKTGTFNCGTGWKTIDAVPFDLANNYKTDSIIPDLIREVGGTVVYPEADHTKCKVTGLTDDFSFIGKNSNSISKTLSEVVNKNAKFEFYATADAGYKIKEVTYKVGTGEAVVITGNSGKYTIPANKITDDTVISVKSMTGEAIDLSKCSVTAIFIVDGVEQTNTVPYDKTLAASSAGITASKVIVEYAFNGITKTLDNSNYSVSYKNNKSAGTAFVVVSAIGGGICTGSKEQPFTIVGRNMSVINDVVYSKKVKWLGKETPLPDLTITDNLGVSSVLADLETVSDPTLADYRVVYTSNAKPGKAIAYVIGLNGYEGLMELPYSIEKPKFGDGTKTAAADISSGEYELVVPELSDCIYDGSKKTPEVEVSYGPKTDSDRFNLILGKDYTVKYGANKNAGYGTVTITGKGNYTGSVTRKFTISRKSFSVYDPKLIVTVPNMPLVKSGVEVKPNPVVKMENNSGKIITLKKGTDYDVEYQNNTDLSSDVSKAKVIIKGKKNFEGSQEISFSVVDKGNDISKAFVFDIKSDNAKKALTKEYNGSPLELGSTDLGYIIKNKDGSDLDSIGIANNFKISYGPNINVGKVKVTITGAGSYYGSKTVTMTIEKKKVTKSDYNITYDGLSYDTTKECYYTYYTGYANKPKVIIEHPWMHINLVEGKDYTVSYKNNTNAGEASITVKFKGNYTGSTKSDNSFEEKFKIEYWTLKTDPDIVITTSKPEYLGGNKDVKPTVTFTYKGLTVNPKAYKVSYSKARKLGDTATISIAPAKGAKDKNILPILDNSTGKVIPLEISCPIVAADLNNAVVTAVKTQIFKKGAVKPKISVKCNGITLKEGRDYTVSYEYNGKVTNFSKGEAVATISAVNNSGYTGSKEIRFIIK